MVSHGRALAVAAAWIVVPLGVAALAFGSSGTGEGWDVMVPYLALSGFITLAPLSLLAAAIVIARRSEKATSAVALGTRAGVAGLVVAVLVVTLYATVLLR